MIAKIIEYSARNKFIVVLLVFFLGIWGYWAMTKTPLDAIPDLSDTQVIIFTEWVGRSPDLVEDQITYPITSTLLAAPKVQAVRGFSYLGSSFIYVIFEEGTDIYWARSRILEYLQAVKNKLPANINPVLGPDATSLGWGFSYAVVDSEGKLDLAQLRSLQDWNLKLALESVAGVSQVASLGGFVKQYQITVDPNRLSAYGIPLSQVMTAVRRSNLDVEGRVIEFSGVEYMVRGRGYLKGLEDLEVISLGTNGAGTPIYLKDVARIQLGPEIRRGIADLDGRGEVTGGIVIVRFGENVLNVIDRVKEKIKKDIEPSLPRGVKIVTTYDRSDLIQRSIATLKDEIIKLSIAVSVVCIVFLFHLPSALVVILTLPLAIIISFILMYYLQVTSNIMSLSGIAIAIGAMVDASIIMVENAHKKLEEWEADKRSLQEEGGVTGHGGNDAERRTLNAERSRTEVIIEAAQEVGPSLFFSLLVIMVGFLPVFTLQAQAGRLFKPLAYTKTFAMLFASLLAVTLTPVLMTLFIRGKIGPEEKNPISWLLHKIYEPVVHGVLRFRKTVLILGAGHPGADLLPLQEVRHGVYAAPLRGDALLHAGDRARGFGLGGFRIARFTGPAAEKHPGGGSGLRQGRAGGNGHRPGPAGDVRNGHQPQAGIQVAAGDDRRKTEGRDERLLTIPGVANSFTMPIKARIDMLATGIRTPVGIKVLGPRIEEIERIGLAIEQKVKEVPGTRSAYAERVTTGYFLDVVINRQEAARYGLNVEDIQEVVEAAIGGMNVTTTVEGRERYPVNIRYPRELRDSLDHLNRVLIPIPEAGPAAASAGGGMGAGGGRSKGQVPLGQVAEIRTVKGPTAIKSEEGQLSAYVYVDFSGRDVGGYVEEAKKKVASLKIPDGYRLIWSGEYEYLIKTQERLKLVIPLTLLIIFVLIFLNTRSVTKTLIVLLAVPFSLVGSFWLLYLLNYNLSIAVWVGIIALAGLDAETGVVMLLYLELAYDKWKKEGRLSGLPALKEAILYGAVKRIRPKVMTVSVILAGLIPILFSHGAGSDVMKRIAAPMVGGVVTSLILELILYPTIYFIWKGRELTPK